MSKATSKAVTFALRMHKIPRRAVRCDLYGTISVEVDRVHAAAIIRKVVPTATSVDLYDAISVLQDRLDER